MTDFQAFYLLASFGGPLLVLALIAVTEIGFKIWDLIDWVRA